MPARSSVAVRSLSRGLDRRLARLGPFGSRGAPSVAATRKDQAWQKKSVTVWDGPLEGEIYAIEEPSIGAELKFKPRDERVAVYKLVRDVDAVRGEATTVTWTLLASTPSRRHTRLRSDCAAGHARAAHSRGGLFISFADRPAA